MNIGNMGGIGGYYGGAGSYGFGMGRIPSVAAPQEAEKLQEAVTPQKQEEPVAGSAVISQERPQVSAPSRKDAPLEDVSLTFNKQDSFDRIGKDSDIRSLDMQKAISDMRKDQVLQQYQFFVGSSRALGDGAVDGVVLPK